jgi:hypothetical protein
VRMRTHKEMKTFGGERYSLVLVRGPVLTYKARRYRRALLLHGSGRKVSELNLQRELNQAALTVAAQDLAEAAVVHSIAWGSVVSVIEDVEHLRLEHELDSFKQGKVLVCIEVDVLVRRIMQVISALVPASECGGLRECGRVQPLLQGFSPSSA